MSIHLYTGCMFAGKTSKLIEHYNLLKDTKNVCVINYFHDTRYDPELLSTHDNKKIECLRLKTLDILISTYLSHDVFLINEAQFFPNLYDIVNELCDTYNKDVYIYALDSDFERKPFGDICNILPVCTSITKLYANCELCKKDNTACFTHRLNNNKKQCIIDSTSYIPLCRKCYLFLNK
jgi:thymidine kinase